MSIYANKQTIGSLDLLGDITDRPGPSFGEYGDTPTWMSNGQGKYMQGTTLDLALLRDQYEDKFSTVGLSKGMLIAGVTQDSATNGIYQNNVSSDESGSLLDARSRTFTDMMGSMFGLSENDIAPYRDTIYTPENMEAEVARRSGFLGAIPTINGARPGEEEIAIAGVNRTWGDLAEERGLSLFKQQNKVKTVVGWSWADADRRDSYTLKALFELGQIDEKQYEAGQQSDEVRSGIIAGANDRVLLSDSQLKMLDESVFPQAVAAANELNLEPNSFERSQFIYEKASQNTIKALTEQFNGVRSPEEAKNLLAQMSAMAAVVGPDFVDEAIMHVTMRDDSWRETAWASIIPDDMRAVLEAAGHSHDTFASSNNPYAYRIKATLEAERYVATTAREQLFKKDMHDGWFNWTRRLTDTVRTDFAGDPYAMYFTIPTVLAGVATMGLSTVGTTSVGRAFAYSAIDGLVAGTAEGFAASQIGISDAFSTGSMLELDYSGVGTNMLYYGAAGGIGGGLLGGGIASIGPAGRSLGRTAKHVDETVAATGITGAARKQAAINEIVKREAGISEIEGASLHTHIENTGLAIRLNRGEVEARDVLTEVLPNLVQRRDGEDVSSVVDDLFSSEVLAENGMSQADAVNLVFGIQRALGPGGQLGSEEFDLIIRGALKASREFAEEGGTDLAGSTASRQARIDASLKANGVEVKKRFVGGSGAEALNPDEVKTLRNLTHKLKHSDIPGQKPITKSEVVALAKLALRLNDEAQLRGVRNLLANSRRLDDTALEWFDEKMGKIIELGKAAREDKFLQDALDVETALSLLANERTIRVTKELGTSPTKVMNYIAKYKGLVGDVNAIARLNAEMPDAARAVTKIAEGEGLEILKDLPSSFNVNRFLQESNITDKVRKMQKFRTNLRRKVTKTLDTENIAPEDFAARVDSTVKGVSEVGEGSRRQKVYENLRRELGLSDADDAFDRLVARIVADLPFAAYGSAMKTEILSKAINRLILKTSPDAVKIGEEGITRGFIRQIFKGSSLGERLEKNIARITLFPITQAKLFRHRNRILRGVSNWITGQHITNRVYGNSTDFMSVESIVEGASRESLPYVQTAMGIRTKLGRKNYQIFDTEFLHLRQKGNFDNLKLEDISPEVRALYENADDLLADLRAVQREYTGFMERAMDELAEAGYPMPKGQSATRYIPHVIKGNLNPEQIESFMAGFRRMKVDQLLNGSAKLDLEVLDGLGWIRLLEGSTTDGKGNKINKTFSIPADSPFYRSADGAANEEFAKQVIKEGWSGLVRHSKESASSTSVASAPRLGEAQKIRARQNVDIYRVRQEVNEITGTDPNFPLGRSADEAADAEAVARGIAGTDAIISRLEDQLDELMGASEATRLAYLDATGESVSTLMAEISSMILERRRVLMAHANRELSAGRAKSIRRKPMNQNQKIKIVNDRELFAAQSSGHTALLNRLDNMIVEGYLTDESARVIMLAFVDVDPHKMLGMSFVRMDNVNSTGVFGRAYDTEGLGDGTGLVTLRRGEDLDGADPVTVASIMVHEVSHLAFLSASPRMQAVMQSLFEQVKSGRNREMAELFEQFGLATPHTFSNVHEFMAALAEITLVQNQAKAAPKNGMIGQLLSYLGKFWKELIGDVAVLSKEGESIAEGILGKEQFSAVRSAIKNIYDSVPSETPVDNLKRIFDLEEATKVDAFGGSAAKLDEAQIAGLIRKAKKARDTANKAASDPKYRESDRIKLAEKADKAEAAVAQEMERAATPKLTEVEQARNSLVSRYIQDNPKAKPAEIDSVTEALGLADYEGALFKNGEWPVKADGTRLTEDELYASLKATTTSRMASKAKQVNQSDLSEAGKSRQVSSTTAEGSTVEFEAKARDSFERQLAEDREEGAALLKHAAESGNKATIKQAEELNERMNLAEALMDMGVLRFEAKRDQKDIRGVKLLPLFGQQIKKLGVTEEQIKSGLAARNISISDAQIKKLFNKGGMLNAEDLKARQAKLRESLEGVEETRKAQAEANLKAETEARERALSDAAASSDDVQNDMAKVSAGEDTRTSVEELQARYEEEAQARLEAENKSDEELFAGMEGPEAPAPKTEAVDEEAIMKSAVAEAEGLSFRVLQSRMEMVLEMERKGLKLSEEGQIQVRALQEVFARRASAGETVIRGSDKARAEALDPEVRAAASDGRLNEIIESRGYSEEFTQDLFNAIDDLSDELPEGYYLGGNPLDGTVDETIPRPPKTEAGDGTPPKDPPKTARGAGDAGEEPKPKPKPKLDGTAGKLEEYFNRKMKSKITTEAGDFNAKHRLSGQGSLSDLYRRAVEGDLDVLSDGYKNRLRESGRAVMSPVDNVARDYIDNAGGGFKGASIISTGDVDAKIGQLGDINRLTQRTFSQDDFDGPGGEELSRLFAENSSSMEGVIRYAEGALASIRLQKGLDELVGSKGATMNDLLLMVKQSLTENAIADSRSGRKAIGSLTKKQVQDIDSYMEQLKDLYLRARGINPIKDTSFARASRITQNLTYSLLGPKFAMSVAFVESVSGILRMSGLNPLKMARNTGLLFGALVDMAQGSAARSHPAMARWMAATGIDKKIMSQTVQDLSYELSNLKSTSMAKFGAMNTMEDGDLMMTFMDRLRNHWANIKASKDASGEGNRIDAFFDGVEAFTAGSADLGGLMSGMLPMTNAVRTVASNQAKSVLFKHLDKLMELSNRMAGENVTLKEVIGMARDIGVPRQTAVYAAEAGLLRAGVLEEFVNISGASASTNARQFSLNDLTRQVSESNNRSRQGTVGIEFDEAVSSQKALRDQVVPAVNNFIMYFTGEMSPELRGTMRFTGTNPLMDLLFQITSYPLAAYQALVKNGVYARGPLMTTGLLMSLVALEANNRHLQNVLDPNKDEDARKKSMEWFTTPMTTQKVVETMATQGLASPLFGAVSPYLRDLVGNPMLKAVGSDVKNFPGRPFASPAIGTGQRLYNSLSRSWGHVTSDDPTSDRAMTSYEKLFKLAKDSLTPLNALPIELGMNAYSAATNNYKAASLAVTEGSKRLMPGSVPPSMGDFSYFKWMAADEQPSGFDQIDLPPSNSMPESTPAPQPRASAPAAPAAQPSEGLADLLNRNK